MQPPAPPRWVAPWLPSSSPSPNLGVQAGPCPHPRVLPPSAAADRTSRAATLDTLPKRAGCTGSKDAGVDRLSPCPLIVTLAPVLCPCYGVVSSTGQPLIHLTSLTFLRGQRLRRVFLCSKEDSGIPSSLQVQMFTVSVQRARFNDICS